MLPPLSDRAWRAALWGSALLALLLRLPTLALRRLLEGDGVHYAWLARLLLAGDASGIANPYWSNLWPGAIAGIGAVTGLDVEAAGRVASLLSGVLLVVATGRLAARLFGRAAGVLAATAAAVHPWLIHFSTLVYSESLFALLLVAVLLAGERVLREPGRWRAALVGLTGGAALLTRPEAWAAIAAILAALLLRGRRKALPAAAVIAAVIAAAVLARAGLVHRYHGRWDLFGSKGAVNLLVGLAETDAGRERLVREVADDGESRLEQRARETSLGRMVSTRPSALARHAGRNLARLAGAAWRVFPPIPAAPGHARPGAPAAACLVLAGAGAAFGLRRARSRPGAVLLVSTGALHAAGLAALLVHDRLVVALTPLFLVLLAGGAARVGECWPARRRLLLAAAAAALIAAGPASLLALLRAPRLAYAEDPPVQLRAARWLSHHVDGPVRLMSPTRGIAFYLLDATRWQDDVDLPWGGLDRVVAIARARSVDVIAAAEWHLVASRHPAASRLLVPTPGQGLEHLVTLGEPPERILLHRVVAAPDTRARPGTP